MRNETAIVIGAGITGLTTAVVLRQSGWRVRIWAKGQDYPSTSSAAAAIWLPFKAYPEDQVARWAIRTYEVLRELSIDAAAGIFFVRCLELFERTVPTDPGWRALVNGFALATAEECRAAGAAGGFAFQVPVIDPRFHLAWLRARLRSAGTRVETRELTDLEEPLSSARLVVNCTGLGARELARDPGVYPIRGQVEHVPLGKDHEAVMFHQADGGCTYLIPRSDLCVLGGTVQPHEFDLAAQSDVTADIRARCAALRPDSALRPGLRTVVGLRPGRAAVRVERMTRADGKWLVHNYGHGGSGYTINWGCAETVRDFFHD